MSNTPNYEFKSKILINHAGLLNQVRKAKLLSYLVYAETLTSETGLIPPFLARMSEETLTIEQLYTQCNKFGLRREFRECLKISKSFTQRTKRLRNRIEKILNNGASVFATLTFNDETLNKTNEKQRRIAVVRYLKQFNCEYVANIDYGKNNHREHYHALVNSKNINLDAWRKYGSVNVKRVRLKELNKDSAKLAKYIAKLTNHAIKETTKRAAIIYSR